MAHVVDLGTATRLTSVTVSVGTPGADLEMWAADPSTTAMPILRPGGTPVGFTKVSSATDVGLTVVFAPAQAVTTRFVLVWFTTLPAVPNRVVPSIHCAHSDGHLYADSIAAVHFTRG